MKLNPDDPAFEQFKLERPGDEGSRNIPSTPITVRAYIATAALQSVIANSVGGRYPKVPEIYETAAQAAVSYADALIAELNKP